MAQMKEQIKTPERAKQNRDKQSIRYRVQKLSIRMLKELSEDLSSIKMIQLETKDTLIEIQNNLQETTVEWMKSRIKSMIWNIRKQKTTNQNKKKKREFKKNPRIV